MNVVDVVLVVVALLAAYQGARVGALVQVCAILGFLGGLYLGALLASVTVRWAHTPDGPDGGRTQHHGRCGLRPRHGGPASSAGCSWSGSIPGSAGRSTPSWEPLSPCAAALVTFWLLASTLVNSSSVAVDSAILQSRVINALNSVLPPPPSVFSPGPGLPDGRGVPAGVRRAGPGLGPAGGAALGQPSSAGPVLAAQASTVKVEGYGCGVLQEGSGFVAAPGLVVTNAHVVAGIAQPLVQVGTSVMATKVVYFDPSFDLAVLRVSGLTAPVLRLDPATVDRGTQAAVLGYPDGGPFTADGAGVMALFEAQGRDIYGQALTVRNVYEINALVRPGNSGGPLVLPDGEVVGVVFSRSTTDANVGYALTSPDVHPPRGPGRAGDGRGRHRRLHAVLTRPRRGR